MAPKPQPQSNQDAFNNVWQHFIVEGNKPAIDAGGACVYRGTEGKMCAIGCQLADDVYDPMLERKTFMDISDVAAGKPPAYGVELDTEVAIRFMGYFSMVTPKFMDNMQEIHDRMSDFIRDDNVMDRLEQQLIHFAEHNNITIPGEARATQATPTV